MLENLINEATILAAKDGKNFILDEHVQKAYYCILAGSEKKDRSNINKSEQKITAVHEAGHALATKFLMPQNTVSKVTIIPSTKGAGGYSLNISPDKLYYSKKDLESQIMISFAGRAAEEIKFGIENVTTGASNDIEKATLIVKDYVVKYGMSTKFGLLNSSIFNDEKKVIEECMLITDDLYKKTLKLITDNIKTLDCIADNLIDKETLLEKDLDDILELSA